MKFSLGKKETPAKAAAPVNTSAAPRAERAQQAPAKAKPAPDGRKQVLLGFVFLAMSFVGGVSLFYMRVSAQEDSIAQLTKDLDTTKAEKDFVNRKAETLEAQVGRVIDRERVVKESGKIHGGQEASRRSGALWIDRKSSRIIITLGALNGVDKGNFLNVYDGDAKFASVKVTSALDVVAYVEPVDMSISDFRKDYYSVRRD